MEELVTSDNVSTEGFSPQCKFLIIPQLTIYKWKIAVKSYFSIALFCFSEIVMIMINW